MCSYSDRALNNRDVLKPKTDRIERACGGHMMKKAWKGILGLLMAMTFTVSAGRMVYAETVDEIMKCRMGSLSMVWNLAA